MSYSFTLFLVVSILFHCYGINGQESEKEPQITPQKGKSPISNAGLMIQQVIQEITHVGQMYLFYRENQLLFADVKVNGSFMIWNVNTGKTERHFIKGLEKEKILTVTPDYHDRTALIIGSNLNLRIYKRNNDTENTITAPIIKFKEPGFIIGSAYADQDGTLFALLVSKDPKSKLGKLYKVQNKRAQLVKELPKGPGDFRFNEKCTKMFMIYENGSKIKSFDYDMKKSELSENHTDVFDKNDHPELKNNILKSVVLDRNAGHLWVSAAGPNGYLLEINPDNKQLIGTTPLPNQDLTYVTFGAEYWKLFVGSKSTCVKGKGQGAIYSVTGMSKQGATDKPFLW